MQQLFAVIRTRGSAWQESRTMEGQQEWAAHAAFMNALAKDGFIVAGGPLEGTSDVLLIVRAGNSDEIIKRFATDPWSGEPDLLRISRISPWNLRLGSL